MDSKIKRFFDRLTRNSNDEIDELRKDVAENLEKFYKSQIDNLDRISNLANEIGKNYVDYLADNKKLRDDIATEQEAIKAELEKERKDRVGQLRLVAEIVTNTAGHLADKKKELDRIL